MLTIEDEVPFLDQPWGYERLFASTPEYEGRYIFIEAGNSSSRKYHQHTDKTIYVLAGPFHIETGPDEEEPETLTVGMLPGEAYRIEPGTLYRYTAPPDNDVELIEVSTTHAHDMIRVEDDYNRVPPADA